MDPLPDNEAARAILADAEAGEAQVKAQLQDAYDKWRQATAEMKKALAQPPEGF